MGCPFASSTVHTLWSRPSHLRTTLEGVDTLLTYDGDKHSKEPV